MTVGWSALAGAVPVYWLYSLVFVDHGVTTGQLSVLLAIWSATAVVAEVPTGALADRWSRRGAMVLGSAMEAAGFLAWILMPNVVGYGLGFVLWGVGGSFASGALEALLFDGLRVAGAEREFGRVLGRVRAAELLVQPPAAVVATVLFAAGGHALVLWVSVAWTLVGAGVASRLPDVRFVHVNGDGGDELGYLATLRAGVTEAARVPAVRAAVIAVSLVGGLDAIDEFFPLLARDWGVSTTATPVTLAVISLVGAAGAALAGRASLITSLALGVLLVGAGLLLWWFGSAELPVGLASVSVFYGVFRLVAVVLETRLQEQITGPSRATVGSVAAVGVEISALALFAAWAWGGLAAVAAMVVVAGVVVSRPQRSRPRVPSRPGP